MKTTVSNQELARLVEESQHFFTVAGGINFETTKAAVQEAIQNGPVQASVGYAGGVLFIYNLD